MSKTVQHDTLVIRLAQMLVKLNEGQKLDPYKLADEFNVNLRTIQRDLNERFSYLPLQKIDGCYALDPAFLGKLSTKDIHRFASLAGIQGLFPSLDSHFLRDIFDKTMESAFLVRGHHYEDLRGKEKLFQHLEEAILATTTLNFEYRKLDSTVKSYQSVQPYRLVNQKGIWYLAAVDAGKLKTFAFTQLQTVQKTGQTFQPDTGIHEQIDTDEGVWLSEDKKEVVLKISPEVAGYFMRRKLIANQIIEKELEDGGLIVSAKVGHVNQILPIVRYWIPHVRIISPEGLQEKLVYELSHFSAL